MRRIFNSLRQDQSGQDLFEYALIAALIALSLVSTMQTVATAVGNAFATVDTKFTNALG